MLNKNTDEFPDLGEIKYWVFDLDNTLYSHETDLFTQVDHNMGLFIQEMFGVSYTEAKKRQRHFFMNYGTTLRGLMSEHGVDPYEYLEFVHDIDFTVLKVNEVLNEALAELPGEKFIYTNASTNYAKNVLSHIGLEGGFKDIFDIHDAKFLPKPDMRSYHKMLKKFAIDPNVSIMIEDIAGNLNPAAELGMTTVWLPTNTHWSDNGQNKENIDHTVADLSHWLKNIVSAAK